MAPAEMMLRVYNINYELDFTKLKSLRIYVHVLPRRNYRWRYRIASIERKETAWINPASK